MPALPSLESPERLKATRAILAIEPSRASSLDRLVHLAADLAATPIAAVTIVQSDRQYFAAQVGLPKEVADAGSSDLDGSICQYAVAQGKPLVVGDLREDPVLRDHPAATSVGVMAYAGMPLITRSHQTVGTLCVVDTRPREWSDELLGRLSLLADLAVEHFELQQLVDDASFRRTWKAIPELNRR